MAKKNPTWLILFSILSLSLGLRLYHLGTQSYWIDEMVSLYFSSRDSWLAIFTDNHPFLYHLLLKFWILIFGFAEASTRLLSVIFSTATTYVIYLLGLRLFKNKKIWAYLAALMHAISAFSIIYAQETRMYTLFELAAALNLLFFYETFFEGKKPRNFYISCVFLALTHYLSILIFAFEAVFVFGTRAKNIRAVFRALGIGFFILGLSYINNFSWFHLEWQKLKYNQEAASHWPLETLLNFSNLSILSLILYLVFFCFTLWLIRKNRQQRTIFFWLGGLIFFSITDLQILTDITHRALLIPRYLIFLNPAWILLFVFCMSVVEKRRAQIWGSVIVIIAILFVPKAYFDVKAPWRDVAAKIVETSLSSLVLTTRTLTIAVPYLEKHHIPVEKLDIKDVMNIKKYFSRVENIWILENYWGADVYFDDYERELRKQGLNVVRSAFKTPYSEPLQLLRVTKPSKK